MSTIALVIIGALVVALILQRVFYTEKQRSADRLDEQRRADLQKLEDEKRAMMGTLRAIAITVENEPENHPIRVLVRNHVYEPGLHRWKEQGE